MDLILSCSPFVLFLNNKNKFRLLYISNDFVNLINKINDGHIHSKTILSQDKVHKYVFSTNATIKTITINRIYNEDTFIVQFPLMFYEEVDMMCGFGKIPYYNNIVSVHIMQALLELLYPYNIEYELVNGRTPNYSLLKIKLNNNFIVPF